MKRNPTENEKYEKSRKKQKSGKTKTHNTQQKTNTQKHTKTQQTKRYKKHFVFVLPTYGRNNKKIVW